MYLLIKSSVGSVTSFYEAGETYFLEYTITSANSNLFGFQSLALDSLNMQGGTFGTQTSGNSQIVDVNGIDYLEQLAGSVGTSS